MITHHHRHCIGGVKGKLANPTEYRALQYLAIIIPTYVLVAYIVGTFIYAVYTLTNSDANNIIQQYASNSPTNLSFKPITDHLPHQKQSKPNVIWRISCYVSVWQRWTIYHQ